MSENVRQHNSFPTYVDENMLVEEERHLWDISAERSFLSMVMNNPDMMVEADAIEPEMLQFPTHKYIFGVMKYIAKRAHKYGWEVKFDKFTALSLAKELGAEYVTNFHTKTEGMQKWDELVDMYNYAAFGELGSYIQIVKDRAMRIRLFRQARQQQLALLDLERWQTTDIVRNALASSAHAMQSMSPPATSLADAAAEAISDPLFGSRIRIPSLHRLSSVIKLGPGTLSTISARSKTGKSLLLSQIALDLAGQQVPILWLDTEMGATSSALRLVRNLTGLTDEELQLTDNRAAVDACLEKIRAAESMMTYQFISDMHPDEIASRVEQFGKSLQGTRGLVVYDWLSVPSEGRIPEWIALGHAVDALRRGAVAGQVALIVAAQQNRSAIGMDHVQKLQGGEGAASGSDRIVMKSDVYSSLYAINDVGLISKLMEAGCPASHFLMVDANRHGPSRVMIPMLRCEKTLRFSEVTGPAEQIIREWRPARAAAPKRTKMPSQLPAVSR